MPLYDPGSPTSNADALRMPVQALDGLAVSGSVTSAAVLFSQDMLGYQSITVQVTSAGTTCTITYENSDDNTNWVNAAGISSTLATTGNAAVTSTTTGLWIFPRRGRYFRARVSTYTSGTVTVTGNCHLAPTIPLLSAQVNGTVNESGGVSGAVPVTIACEGRTSSKTSVGNAQIVRPIATVDGRQIFKPHSIPENQISYAAAANGISNTTTAVTIFAAAGASIRNYLTHLDLSWNALGAGSEVAIRDGAGGTVLWRGVVPITTPGSMTIQFDTPLKGTANTLMEVVTLTASVTGALYVNAEGYVGP